VVTVCAGAGGVKKVDLSRYMYVGSAAISALVNKYGAKWAVGVAAFLASVTLDLDDLCANDPPAVPTFTADDVIAVLNPGLNLANFKTATDKFYDLVKAFAWSEFCECASVASPAAPTPPTEPTNAPDFANVPVLNGVCDTLTTGAIELKRDANNPQAVGTRPSRGGYNPHIIPTGSSVARIHGTSATAGAVHAAGFKVFWYDMGTVGEGAAHIGTFTLPGTFTFDVPIIDGVVGYALEFISNPFVTNVTDTVNATVDIYCGGGPNQPISPCCPPDTIASGLLEQILESVTLLQRQLAPFAHILGTVHSGISGQGTFAVQGLLGAKLELTTTPAAYGEALDQPTYRFGLGYLSLETPDGVVDERRVDRSTISWFPRLMSDATVLGYSLAPGVVATLTEIEREP
jgi:hypothetical protein